jgi:hypothetical protein
MREGNASQETRHATLEEAKTNEKGRGNQKTDEVAIWQALKADLISVKEDLEKEERVSSSFTQRLSNIIARVPHATHANTNPLGLEARLERIETLLRAPKQPPTQATSWAKVAATITRQAGAPEAILPARHTVRVQMAQTQGKSNEEILREVKKTITGAAAVRILQSGDIDVTVPDEAAKDRAQGLPSTEELKIFKRDYLVEVPSVPLSVRVACEKGADNSHLAATICEASRTLSPGLQITRIRWLHNQLRREQMQEAGGKPSKTRGSLIIGFSTQEMQRQAIRGGLVVNAQLFEVRPFERSLLVTQCFKCQQWGHTQSACGKRVKCAQCAGDHATKDCPRERISCVNCGKRHRAWQQRECSSFQTYFQAIQNRRTALYTQAVNIRTALTGPRGNESQIQTPQADGWTTISRKRNRVFSPNLEDTQRRLGRPTYIEQAARDPGQQRLDFGQGGATSSQTPRTGPATAPIAEVEMTQDGS